MRLMTVEEFVVAGWLFVSLFFFNLILKTHEALLTHTHTHGHRAAARDPPF